MLNEKEAADSEDEEIGSTRSYDEDDDEIDEDVEAEKLLGSFKAPHTWMLALGLVLAGCAGITNAVAFLSLHAFVTHVTGTTTKIGMRLEGVRLGNNELGDPFNLLHAFLLVVSFMFGAFLCGLIIRAGQALTRAKAMYGLALVGNACLLVVSLLLAPKTEEGISAIAATTKLAAYSAAVASGLQNAMCTMHFGAIVRTTHVTGAMTDIGSTLGEMTMLMIKSGCQRSRLGALDDAEFTVAAQKFMILVPLWFCFAIGGVLGAFLQQMLGAFAFLIPAAVTATVGIYLEISYALS